MTLSENTITRLNRLFRHAARQVRAAHSEDLCAALWVEFETLRNRRPACARRMLRQSDGYIKTWAWWRARDEWRAWLREAGELWNEEDERAMAVEWSARETCGAKGERRHVAIDDFDLTDDEARALIFAFIERVNRHVIVSRDRTGRWQGRESTGAGLDPLDVWLHVQSLPLETRRPIFEAMSGFTYSEIGNRRYRRMRAALASLVA